VCVCVCGDERRRRERRRTPCAGSIACSFVCVCGDERRRRERRRTPCAGSIACSFVWFVFFVTSFRFSSSHISGGGEAKTKCRMNTQTRQVIYLTHYYLFDEQSSSKLVQVSPVLPRWRTTRLSCGQSPHRFPNGGRPFSSEGPRSWPSAPYSRMR
jgi:hypothetical protein